MFFSSFFYKITLSVFMTPIVLHPIVHSGADNIINHTRTFHLSWSKLPHTDRILSAIYAQPFVRKNVWSRLAYGAHHRLPLDSFLLKLLSQGEGCPGCFNETLLLDCHLLPRPGYLDHRGVDDGSFPDVGRNAECLEELIKVMALGQLVLSFNRTLRHSVLLVSTDILE